MRSQVTGHRSQVFGRRKKGQGSWVVGLKVEKIFLILFFLLPMTYDLSPITCFADEIAYTGRENRDPLDNSIVLEKTEVVVEESQEAVFPVERYLVSAIIWGSNRPQAIVNNEIVNIGQTLEGGEIVGIDKNGVRINFEGKEVLLAVQ